MTSSNSQPCAAPRTSCGTASGWRSGGRCPDCRAAHNQETNQYCGITPTQREEVLALLRAGKTPQEAADAIGKTPASLSAAAAHNAELRAALDGLPPSRQVVARYGQYLAALAYCGGNRAAASERAGISYRAHTNAALVGGQRPAAAVGTGMAEQAGAPSPDVQAGRLRPVGGPLQRRDACWPTPNRLGLNSG